MSRKSNLSSISFVIPCLNEELTLPPVLEKINRIRQNELKNRRTEIVVADNGSTDNSIGVARRFGARVVKCSERGYGAALQCGFAKSRHEIVVFADADNTYDFLEAPGLIEELEKGYDLVMGSRLDGTIYPGAMPFLHHRLGTPVLNFIINLLYAGKNSRIRDCNSGFRCFRRYDFDNWQVHSNGMEFASEMIIKALKSGASISQIPISLYPDVRNRIPHLQTWRDGMRHLLQILLYSQKFFAISGLLLFLAGWLIMLFGLFLGPSNIGSVRLFGLHSMMFALLFSLFGQNVWSIGLFLAARQGAEETVYDRILRLGEDRLFWLSLGLMFVSAAFLAAVFVNWAMADFKFLAYQRETLTYIAFGSTGIMFVFHALTSHMLKRT